MQNIDYMDVDQIVDVPDTPDKDMQNINERDFIRKESTSSLSSHSRNGDIFRQEVRNLWRGRNKLAIHGGSKRQHSCPVENLSISDKSECTNSRVIESRKSSSSINTPFFERMVEDRIANHDSQSSVQSQLADKGKALINSESSVCFDGAAINLAEQRGNPKVLEKASECGSFGNWQAEFKERSITANEFSFSNELTNSSLASGYASKGNERVNDTYRIGSSYDYVKGPDFSEPKGERSLSAPLHSFTSSRGTRLKRLVRNGCISPHNMAKARQVAEKQDDVSEGIVQNDKESVVSRGSPDLVNIMDLVAEEDTISRVRGKRVINHSFSSKPSDAKASYLSNRIHIPASAKVYGGSDSSGDAFRCFEEFGVWRTTHNHMMRTNQQLSDKDRHSSRGADEALFSSQQQNNVGRRVDGHGSCFRACNNFPDDQDLVSSQLGSAPSVVQSVSRSTSQLANAYIKRQKQGSTSSNHGECSTSNGSEIVFLGSSGEPLRSTRTQNHDGMNTLDPVIGIDGFSPEVRHSSSHKIVCSSNDASDARTRQVEADEILAYELQQQLYNEMPAIGIGEIDADIALSFQQEEDLGHTFSHQSLPTFSPRGSFTSDFRSRSQSHSSQNPSIHRGAQARLHTSTRMARLRNRFPGQPRTIISRDRGSLFPSNMDVDMRIHILEILEAFSDMGMASNFLQVQRDFNENDYEMLLALDENNYRVGASVDQINSLPESTVQSDHFEVDCAICLETPTIGDTICHLPCLHKFHRDCIDPWLSRNTSCPVCKSSIT